MCPVSGTHTVELLCLGPNRNCRTIVPCASQTQGRTILSCAWQAYWWSIVACPWQAYCSIRVLCLRDILYCVVCLTGILQFSPVPVLLAVNPTVCSCTVLHLQTASLSVRHISVIYSTPWTYYVRHIICRRYQLRRWTQHFYNGCTKICINIYVIVLLSNYSRWQDQHDVQESK
jgi:hypothetical protein